MKVSKAIKKLKFSGKAIFLLLVLLLYLGVNGFNAENSILGLRPETVSEQKDAKIIDLTLLFEGSKATLKEVIIHPGTISKKSFKLKGEWCQLVVSDEHGEPIYVQSFRDPRIHFYDDFDSSTGKLSGGTVLVDKAFIKLSIPLLRDANTIQVVSPDGTIAWETHISDLMSRIRLRPAVPQWETQTLVYNGDPGNRIDLVFIGDGYTVNDTAKFKADVDTMINYLFTKISPYTEYSPYFNVHIIKVISQESGIDHLGSPKNTALGCYYYCSGVARLVCCDWDTIYAIASTATPYYDKLCVLVNDPVYGGSGGDIAVSYNGFPYWGKHVFNHEFGHSFGFLLDEYLYSSQAGSVSGCNCDTDSLSPKWQVWKDTGSPGIAAFRGCSWLNYFRPTYNECNMNGLQDRFCVVCREQLAKSVNTRVLSFDTYSPLSNPIIQIGKSELFYVNPLTPLSHRLKTYWYVNQIPQGGVACDSFIFSPGDTGLYRVWAVVFDSTDLVLNDPDYSMVDYLEWQVHAIPTDVEEDESDKLLPTSFFLYSNYPNPFNSRTVIRYYLPVKTEVSLSVYDLLGRKVKKLVDQYQTQGYHSAFWDGTDGKGKEVSSGVYFYLMETSEGFKLARKMALIR